MLVAGKKTVSKCKLFVLYKNPLMSLKFWQIILSFIQLLFGTAGADCGIKMNQILHLYLNHSVIESFGMFFKLHSHSVVQFVVSESTECFCFKVVSILNNLFCLFQVFCNLTSCKINICQKTEKRVSHKIPTSVTKNKKVTSHHLHLHVIKMALYLMIN